MVYDEKTNLTGTVVRCQYEDEKGFERPVMNTGV